MSIIRGSWSEDLEQEFRVLLKKGVTRTEAEHARFGLLHAFMIKLKSKANEDEFGMDMEASYIEEAKRQSLKYQEKMRKGK